MPKTENPPIDWNAVPITKLPPGKAYGADDLQRWSKNRATGRSGTGTAKTASVKLRCKKCKFEFSVISVERPKITSYATQPCRQCGGKTRVISARPIR